MSGSDSPKVGELRVWHIPQIGMTQTFYVPVRGIEDAKLVLEVLADYDLFQYKNKVKPDYANVQGLEVFEFSWEEWYDAYGNSIEDVD